MSDEAIAHAGDDEVGLMTSTVALSGAVAVIAHIDGPMLHIASCGDCVAVLGKTIKNIVKGPVQLASGFGLFETF